jgi:SAM-dependent methyltransferase
MNEDYAEILVRQFRNLNSPAIHAFYSEVYGMISEQFDKFSKILEIGSGPGASRLWMGDFNVVSTDLLSFDERHIIGNVDAHNLPFSDGEFDGCFAFDAIHHMSNPYRVIDELIRVTKVTGKIVIVEPFVSPVSYLAYKLFHNEDVSIYLNPEKLVDVVSEFANSGNQTIMQALLKSRHLLEKFESDRIRLLLKYRFAPLSFYLTGGINNPKPFPRELMRSILKFERSIPQKIQALIASRQIVVMINEG